MSIYYKTLLLSEVNMIKETLKKYIIDNNFYVDDIFIFTNEKNKYSFLLGKNGCSMIVDEYLLRNIKSKKLDENLKVKLIQHGLAGLKKPKITLPKNQNENIYFIIDVTKRCNFNCIYCFTDLKDNRAIDNKVLKDISFIIKEGSKVTIAGKTGVGKTTMMNILMRLYPFQKGRILIGGKDITEKRIKDIRKNIS